jgi:hypothetical protein
MPSHFSLNANWILGITYCASHINWTAKCFARHAIESPDSKRENKQQEGMDANSEYALFEGKSEIELRALNHRPKAVIVSKGAICCHDN